ncbi:hypothetical protein ACK8HX_14475 [Oryzobacter sp. R7]|uniref:hypothetical protein n=1 Tax=Oryzobacter faecalis TaxID=3388656 RepID=UPI00398CF6F4
MPIEPDPSRVAAVLTRLDALREVLGEAEDDVLAALVVTGEPLAQRVLDDWLDQVADTLRAVGEAADALAPTLTRFRGGGVSHVGVVEAAAGDDAEARR